MKKIKLYRSESENFKKIKIRILQTKIISGFRDEMTRFRFLGNYSYSPVPVFYLHVHLFYFILLMQFVEENPEKMI